MKCPECGDELNDNGKCMNVLCDYETDILCEEHVLQNDECTLKYLLITRYNDDCYVNGRLINSDNTYFQIGISDFSYYCRTFVYVKELSVKKELRGKQMYGKAMLDALLKKHRGTPVLLCSSPISLDFMEEYRNRNGNEDRVYYEFDVPNDVFEKYMKACDSLERFYARAGFYNVSDYIGGEEFNRTMLNMNFYNLSDEECKTLLAAFPDSMMIPYSATVDHRGLQRYRKEIDDIIKHNLIKPNYLISWHREVRRLVHWTDEENIPSIREYGLLCKEMSSYNNFGQTIHCFDAQYPDNVFSHGDYVNVPIYFEPVYGWGMCVGADDTEAPLRYCVVPYDIEPCELIIGDTYVSKEKKSIDQCIPDFGFTVEEFKQHYPNFYGRADFNMHMLAYAVNYDTDDVDAYLSENCENKEVK